ncbi:MAG: ComEC/Rec2 family competence protein [candidate division Zixibacteria bacterium]|nr:ComEC/Rec2 family competence protein [candidate division Zixibacteria bacterium]
MGAAEKIAKHTLPAPAFWAALAFAAGILLSALTTNNLFFWFSACALAGLFAGLFHHRVKNAIANFGFLALLVGLGALRHSAATDVAAGRSVADFAGLNRRMVVSGRVCELPEIKPGRTRIYLDRVAVGWKKRIGLEGKLLLSVGRPISSFALGDRMEFTGYLDSLWPPANPGSLDFARYMRIRGVEGAVFLKDEKGISITAKSSGNWRTRLAKVRLLVEEKLTQGLPPKAAGVVQGFVLGDTRDIEPSTYELFEKTGTLHLLAVSGANVAWVALLPILFLKLFYVPLRWRYLVALALVWIFVLLTDLQASVLRAAVMFTFWTVSKVVYREISGEQSLGLSALFLLCLNPLWFFDIGFELSYLAAFALIFFSFKEAGYVETHARSHWFLSVLTTPLVAFLATFPLIAFYFNQVTPVSLLSNLFTVPLTMLITWSAFFFAGLNFFGAGSLLSGGMIFLFDALFRIQEIFLGHPFFHFALPHPDGWTTFLLFVGAFALLVFLFKAQRRKTAAYLLVGGLIPLVWLPELKEKPGFALAVLEARGETVAVFSFSGRVIVIGGGRVGQKTHTPRQVLDPFLAYWGEEKIEAYLPLRFDSSGRAASEAIAKAFNPDWTGWPVDEGGKKRTSASPAWNVEYLLAPGDSIPFGLRLGGAGFSFLFLPHQNQSHPPPLDSLFFRPTILVAPLDFSRAESLCRHPKMKAVVSTQRLYRLPEAVPNKLFFAFRDGMVAFKKEGKGLVATAHVSGRKLSVPVL